MKTYLVRIKGEVGLENHKVVGIVRVAGTLNLWEVMDEFDNPHDYEFLRLRGECAFVTIGGSSSPLLGDSVCEQLPDEEDGRKSPKWKTIIEMCGGEDGFKRLYAEWSGHAYNHEVASFMRNEIQ